MQQETDSFRSRLRDLAEPVAGTSAPAVAEALLLLVSGQLAMRLRPAPARVHRSGARELAELLLDHQDRLGGS